MVTAHLRIVDLLAFEKAWTATWQGKGKQPKELLQDQHYPDPSDPRVQAHFDFLKRFFHHKNYILVNGVPLFMVFMTYDNRVLPLLARLRELAMADGFPAPGLHIPQFMPNLKHPSAFGVTPGINYNFNLEPQKEFDADFFYPANYYHLGTAVPESCVGGAAGTEQRPVYVSTITTFDNTPRRDATSALIWDRSWNLNGVAASFERDLVETMVYEACCQPTAVRAKGGKFVVVNAWNEWAEGMVMEPSDMHGRDFLHAVMQAKKMVGEIGCDWAKYGLYRTTVAKSYGNKTFNLH